MQSRRKCLNVLANSRFVVSSGRSQPGAFISFFRCLGFKPFQAALCLCNILLSRKLVRKEAKAATESPWEASCQASSSPCPLIERDVVGFDVVAATLAGAS